MILDKVEKFIAEPEPTTEAAKFNHKILRKAMRELEIFETEPDEGEGGIYANQETNIDPLWLCFFTAFKIAKVSSLDEFYLYQRGVYGACKKIRGATNMKHALGAMMDGGLVGMKELRNAMSECTHINLPPWILKPSRLYDAAAPIGACDALNVFNTLGKPTFSWRYYLCLDFSKKKGAINFVTSLWEMEQAANIGQDEDIRLSERCLHQMLLGRDSPFACTNFLIGNALSAKIL